MTIIKKTKGSLLSNVKGLSPIELLESSLGLCIIISLQTIFERDGIDAREDEFSVEVETIRASNSPSRVEEFTVHVTLPNHLSNEYKKKLIISTEKACTIGNTLKRGVTIHIKN